MVQAANKCNEVLSLLPVLFASFFMGGGETGIDMRDCHSGLGTKYNASGCLIHGLGVTVTGAAPVLIYSMDTGRVLLLMEEELVKI